MAKRELTRKVCERMILRCCKYILKIYKEYNPNGNYLGIAIFNDSISVNNAHWEGADKERPLDFYCGNGEKGSVIE